MYTIGQLAYAIAIASGEEESVVLSRLQFLVSISVLRSQTAVRGRGRKHHYGLDALYLGAIFSSLQDAGVKTERFSNIAEQLVRQTLWTEAVNGVHSISAVFAFLRDRTVVCLTRKISGKIEIVFDVPSITLGVSKLFAGLGAHLVEEAA